MAEARVSPDGDGDGEGDTDGETRRRRAGVRPGEIDDEADAGATPNVGAEHAAARRGATSVMHGPAVKRALRTGELPCPTCGEPNAETRRFCVSCGVTLPAFHDQHPEDDFEPEPPPDSWWRRLTGTTAHGGSDNRTWKQKAKDSGTRRLKYKVGYSMRTRVMALVLMLGLGGGLLAAVTRGPQLLDRFRESRAGDSPRAAELIPSTATEQAAFPAEAATDGKPDTAAAIPWIEDQPRSVGLRIDLGTSEADELIFEFGLPEDNEERQLFQRPAEIEICFDEVQSICQAVSLPDDDRPHEVSLDEELTALPVLRVLGVHERAFTTYDFVLVREVRFKT